MLKWEKFQTVCWWFSNFVTRKCLFWVPKMHNEACWLPNVICLTKTLYVVIKPRVGGAVVNYVLRELAAISVMPWSGSYWSSACMVQWGLFKIKTDELIRRPRAAIHSWHNWHWFECLFSSENRCSVKFYSVTVWMVNNSIGDSFQYEKCRLYVSCSRAFHVHAWIICRCYKWNQASFMPGPII